MRALLPLALLAAACTAPDIETFTRFEVERAPDAETVTARFVSAIGSATETLDVALPNIEDTALSDAIIAAYDDGVEVRVVTDFDEADDPGVAALLDAGVPVTLADDGITYFDFNLLRDVLWTSDQTILTHAWVLADRRRAVVASEAGTPRGGERVVIDLVGEDLLMDLETEHNQVFGGADAVGKTAYDDLAKSIADFRWSYPTQTDQLMEVWFGPQERLTKRIIDATYAARSSVRILTNDFANDGLTDALQDKAELGFDMEVVVGPDFGTSAFFLSQELRTNTPDVAKSRICADVEVPTVVLVDYAPARNGRQYPSQAFVLTHDLYAAARLFRDEEVISDQLIDGTLYVFDDYDAPSGAMATLEALWQDHFDQATGGLDCP